MRGQTRFKKTALSLATAQVTLLFGGLVLAQDKAAPGAAADKEDADQPQVIVVSGQRKALESAQKIKQESDDIVDSVVADEAGKLPDKSITEVLQRVVGITMDRNRSRGDPEHFSVEGSGISIRGLSWGSSTLNGREMFSAGWPGRELTWADVPPELMSAVMVHKNPPAELIEGGVSGQVDLRTALPFDHKGTRRSVTLSANYGERGNTLSPGVSALYSTRWEEESGHWGALIDVSYNRTRTHNDSIQLDAYFPRTDLVPGETVWVPKSASWRTNESDNERAGVYGALQWKKNGMESSLTYFHSGFREQGVENALFSGVENSYRSKIDNAVYDSKGVFQSGTYTYPEGGLGANNFAAGGLGFQTDTGYHENTSQTREIAWNFKWTIDDQWSVQQDLQWVHAKHNASNGVVTLGTFVPSMGLDVSGSPAKISFDQTATEFLANPANYYWNFIMPARSKAEADLYAWRGDAKFKFDDPVLRDFRFGLRLTGREADHINASGTGWYSIAQPWNVKQTSVPGQLPGIDDGQGWQSRGSLGYMSDPRYAGNTRVHSFDNFFNGMAGRPPSLVVPTLAMAKNYPDGYRNLTQLLIAQCEDGKALYNLDKDCSTEGSDWRPLVYDNDPANVSRQSEDTQAIYGSLRFGFDDWKYPVDGNLGLRVVRTHSVAHGYVKFEPNYDNAPPEVPRFDTILEPIDAEQDRIHVLPSLNLKMNFTDKLQGRLALSRSMYRPGFDQLAEYIQLNQNVTYDDQRNVTNITYTGSNTGNVHLKPITSDNYDVTLEWYPRHGQSLTAAVFHKEVKDIIMKSAYLRSFQSRAGNSQDFLITGPDNVAKGSVSGLEIAGSTYFDQLPILDQLLPDWAKGFGISANYTYIDSRQKLYKPFTRAYCPPNGSFNNGSLSLYGCDTNGVPFDNLPIQYLSRDAFNVAFMYDRGPVSSRLAYNWRGRYLQGVDVNGTRGNDATSADPARMNPDGTFPQDVSWGLPTWAEAVGQWDLGVNYTVDQNFALSFSVTNLTDVVHRQTQQQHIGDMGRAWFEPGRSYRVSVNYSF
ncbi:MAG TPA: TonB-dependent receptor [Ideonella sp.]|uniref:TonB-dependent receptor n=1 Tax=Ideonella sp. TaxID=1929293 RepID=UPI002E3444F0|nr:TonB-dependent receptor [Ideonella sp.]HEX5687609.1 TonB-dependent receptor [Ideonella sp.]